MGERMRQKSKLSSLDRVERLALLSSILIWMGVVAFGTGLVIALYNFQVEQVAYAKVADVMTTTAETATVAPTSTPRLYPAGWSTATPTPSQTPTRKPTLVPTRVTVDKARPSATTSLAEPTRDPSPTPTSTPLPTLYPPDRLVISTINLDSAIVPTGWTAVKQDGQTSRTWTVVDEIVGWHKTSALPGSVGNVVLNGHHNIKGEVFRYLVDVEVGDRVTVYARDQVFDYAVTEKLILKEGGEPVEVRRQNASWMEPTQDERVTMITCWPYTNNTHRLIVVAKPVPAPEAAEGSGQGLP